MEFYHDFSALGLSLPQRGGIYPANQAAKAPVLTGYLMFALGKVRARTQEPVTFAELFCADAYYSFLAARFGAAECHAFDSDKDGHLAEARAAKSALKEERVRLHCRDVFAIPPDFRAHIVMNAGGLYHVCESLKALEISYQMATRYLIVQSVVSLATNYVDYFETPAPGWPHGCRFSAPFLMKAILDRGWSIVDHDQNELTGNTRLEDRGSVYFLIEKT